MKFTDLDLKFILCFCEFKIYILFLFRFILSYIEFESIIIVKKEVEILVFYV